MRASLSIPRLISAGLAALLLASPVAAMAGGAVLVRTGGMFLADDSQVIDGTMRSFDQRSDNTFSLSFETRKRHGLALGAEYLTYRHSFTPPAADPGDARTRLMMFTAKKLFIEKSPVHPFVGVGIGGGHTEYTYTNLGSKYTDYSYALVFQVAAGVEFNLDNFLLTVEARHVAHDIDSSWNDYNASGTGIYGGFGFNW